MLLTYVADIASDADDCVDDDGDAADWVGYCDGYGDDGADWVGDGVKIKLKLPHLHVSDIVHVVYQFKPTLPLQQQQLAIRLPGA